MINDDLSKKKSPHFREKCFVLSYLKLQTYFDNSVEFMYFSCLKLVRVVRVAFLERSFGEANIVLGTSAALGLDRRLVHYAGDQAFSSKRTLIRLSAVA